MKPSCKFTSSVGSSYTITAYYKLHLTGFNSDKNLKQNMRQHNIYKHIKEITTQQDWSGTNRSGESNVSCSQSPLKLHLDPTSAVFRVMERINQILLTFARISVLTRK